MLYCKITFSIEFDQRILNGVFMNATNAFKKETLKPLLSLLSCEDTVQRQPSMNKAVNPHQVPNQPVP